MVWKMGHTLAGQGRIDCLWRNQGGKCPVCLSKRCRWKNSRGTSTIGFKRCFGGKTTFDNLELLHANCKPAASRTQRTLMGQAASCEGRCGRLEPYEAEVSRTVLRGRGWREPSLLLPTRNAEAANAEHREPDRSGSDSLHRELAAKATSRPCWVGAERLACYLSASRQYLQQYAGFSTPLRASIRHSDFSQWRPVVGKPYRICRSQRIRRPSSVISTAVRVWCRHIPCIKMPLPHSLRAVRYNVMMPEEMKVLSYLRRHVYATVRDVMTACFKGAATTLVFRVITELAWLGYVTVFNGPDGRPAALQITEKGLKGVPGHHLTELRPDPGV